MATNVQWSIWEAQSSRTCTNRNFTQQGVSGLPSPTPPFPSLIRPPSHPPPIRPSLPMSVTHATFLSKPDRITRFPHGASAGEYENTIPRRAHLAQNMRSENGPKPGPFFDLAVCFLNWGGDFRPWIDVGFRPRNRGHFRPAGTRFRDTNAQRWRSENDG